MGFHAPISVRLSEQERSGLDALAACEDTTASAYVRGLIRRAAGMDSERDERLADLDRRLARLEEMAGL